MAGVVVVEIGFVLVVIFLIQIPFLLADAESDLLPVGVGVGCRKVFLLCLLGTTGWGEVG